MKLTFYGGTGEATGANYVLESGGTQIMIDCGLHQGSHYAETENFMPFAYHPEEIAAVFITHSHLDHIGRLPSLVKSGFHGTIYSTRATRDFAELMLDDSEYLLAKEAEREAKPPLYTKDDIPKVIALWKGLDYHAPIQIGPFKVELYDAGHILGSAIIHIEAEGKTIVFSGDLGNVPSPLIKPTEKIPSADYCLIESTYGDRIHEDIGRRREMLQGAIDETFTRGGVLMIPSFAMERTQDLLFHFHQLYKEGKLPKEPVFVDSPLAIKLTELFKKHEDAFNDKVETIVKKGEEVLTFPGMRNTLSVEESKAINNVPAPKVIIAGSGMSNGGRILHHELRYLSDPKSEVVFVGYQAEGSMGRQLLEGATEVKIFGETVAVRCQKIDIPGYSAHADQPHLLDWLSSMASTLRKVFVVQGEQQSAETLAKKITEEFKVPVEVPVAKESVIL
jgi:metallo-beta-lactamase family protein